MTFSVSDLASILCDEFVFFTNLLLHGDEYFHLTPDKETTTLTLS